jgi:hypothetical protein
LLDGGLAAGGRLKLGKMGRGLVDHVHPHVSFLRGREHSELLQALQLAPQRADGQVQVPGQAPEVEPLLWMGKQIFQ